MKQIQFFLMCIALLAMNVKETSQSLGVVTMDSYQKLVSLPDPSYGSKSSVILKSHTGMLGYTSNITSTCFIKAPTGYGLFAALKLLDLRPKVQDYLTVSVGRDVKLYSNRFSYQNQEYFPREDTYTHYSPDGEIKVTFMTGAALPPIFSYKGFELIFTVQANLPKCGRYTFNCNNGRCISDSLKCDGHNHCGDRSDQQYCGHNENPTSSRVGWISGGVFFAIIGVACALYIIMRKVNRSSRTETIITHPPPTQISSYPPYPQTGAGYPAPPPSYSTGINNKGYH